MAEEKKPEEVPKEEPSVEKPVEKTETKEEVAPAEDKPAPRKNDFDKDGWTPKTSIGKQVKSGEISNIDAILDNGYAIMEPEIIDILLPEVHTELLMIGQSKGKFGGGKRRVFKQTQKKTMEGNKLSFATVAVVGDKNGHVGVGFGKSKETVPAREKAMRNAKLGIIKIRRGCGSWESASAYQYSIPFEVEGKCGSVKVKLIPAPLGTGLRAHAEIAKILDAAGIRDVWSHTLGKTTSRMNVIKATMSALQKLCTMKVKEEHYEKLTITE